MLSLRTRWKIIAASDIYVNEINFMWCDETGWYHAKAIIEASINRKRRRCRAFYYDLSGHRQRISMHRLVALDVSLIQTLTENDITF